jgi:hypothetical protein
MKREEDAWREEVARAKRISLCGWMKDIDGPVDRRAGGQRRIAQNAATAYGRGVEAGLVFVKEHLLFVVGSALGIIFVLVGFAGETFTEQATAAAMEHRLIAIFAKVLGDIILIGVEVDDNNRLAEGGGRKSQQQ